MGAGEVITLVIGISGAITGFYSVIKSAKKSDVDALSKIIDKLNEELTRRETIIKEQERQINERDEIIADLRSKLEDVKCWADDLVKQVISLGGKPVKMREQNNG